MCLGPKKLTCWQEAPCGGSASCEEALPAETSQHQLVAGPTLAMCCMRHTRMQPAKPRLQLSLTSVGEGHEWLAGQVSAPPRLTNIAGPCPVQYLRDVEARLLHALQHVLRNGRRQLGSCRLAHQACHRVTKARPLCTHFWSAADQTMTRHHIQHASRASEQSAG